METLEAFNQSKGWAQTDTQAETMYSLTLLPSGRKGDDSRGKRTNLVFMLGPFIQCSHPYCLRSLSILLSFSFQIDPLCACVKKILTLDVLHRKPGSEVILRLCLICGNIRTRLPASHIMTSLRQMLLHLFLPSHTVPMHSWLQMLGIKSRQMLSRASVEGPFPLPLPHLPTSRQLTSPLP